MSTVSALNFALSDQLFNSPVPVPHRYSYVKRRRNGRVGHIMTPLLIKLWAVYAVIEFALYILALYLKPFGPTWLPSIIRAAILPYIVWGRRLHHAANIYDTKLVPFFDTYSADIENLFSQAQQFWDELNEAFRELAQHLLNRIAVGGLSGAISPINRDPAPETSQVRRPNGAQQTHEAPSALPHDTRTFSTARLLFAGQPSERADTIGNGSLEAMRGVILHTKPEAPKSAFEDSRALRRQFRNRRHASAAGKILEQ